MEIKKILNKSCFNNSHTYIYLTFSAIVTFWLLSLFEICSTLSDGSENQNIGATLVYKLLNDFWAGVVIGLLFVPFYFAFLYIKKPIGVVLIKVLFALVIIIQFALVKYSLTTHINLGADLLGYSLDDMYTTVTASESLSLLYFLPFILMPLLYLGINYLLKKFTNGRQIFATSFIFIIILGSLKLLSPDSTAAVYQNKLHFLTKDIATFQNEKSTLDISKLVYKKEYPLLKPFNETKDVLAPFFNIQEEKPNIVIIIAEGLGSDFIGNNSYGGFTPFLDSLTSKSLYWENFVSNTGRTFGAASSLLGSLPYGEKGFLELTKLPSHISLLSVLKANEYTTSYYCGDDSSFDRKINFLEYNEIDHVTDIKKFGPGYVKTKENSGGFSWGYPDAEIFKKTLSEMDSKKTPRLDVIMTLSNHEPFDFPSKDVYLKKVDNILNTNSTLNVKKDEIGAYKDIFAALLYTDTSIKNFMEAYSKRPEYKNTIFIITGDHRLIPIPQKDELCRFHVPLLIYSPMLKKAEKFKSVSSHWDVTPSLLSFLMNNYKFNKLAKTAWMGDGLDTAKEFRNIHQIPLMRYKGSINDYIYKDYMYSGGELYKINENFETNKVYEENISKTMADSLLSFKRLNAYLTKKNKIFPASLNKYSQPTVEFSKAELATIKTLAKNLTFDQTFLVARDLAFKKDYKKSTLLCDYILNEVPNYSEVRTLKGRMLAWDGKYDKAETELLEAIKRTPFETDAYLALMDVYKWSNQNAKAVQIGKKAIDSGINNPEIKAKLAQAKASINQKT
ncbi:Phosphoglycerol transferase MdoB [Flavobacterium fluvii]|uniref:Phosphoglycerol transferase MdoB n=1 Tax=Flavobacterium fluvii TaxID=468056 RepID=A0A1M5HKV2_9FLAO|nr:alkaline phosphatase family protein [Flavobacterium fluvii]SHG16584.1 Phosphoglycerol transferase MdoB [Flavobacterium fluvii]